MQKENEGAASKNGHRVSIIYEDTNVLVINKPAGLVVHPSLQMLRMASADGVASEYTLADWLLKNYPEIKDVGEPWNVMGSTPHKIYRPGIVHRLDRETSGVMVVAKTQESYEFLKKQFKNRKVQKIYHAFIYGVPKASEGTIDKSIGKSRSNFRKWSAQPGSRGTKRDAITHWRILNRSSSGDHLFAFVELSPETGRTHQLRVHLKAIHHSIVCDKLYAPKRECALNFKRLALHARELTLVLLDGEEKTFTATYPKDFQNALNMVE